MAKKMTYKGQDADGAHLYDDGQGGVFRTAAPPRAEVVYAQAGGQVKPAPATPQGLTAEQNNRFYPPSDFSMEDFLWGPGPSAPPVPTNLQYQTPARLYEQDRQRLSGAGEIAPPVSGQVLEDLSRPPTDKPPAPAPPVPENPYARMASIRGRLSTLDKEIKFASGAQKAALTDERTKYQKALDKVEEDSQVDEARASITKANKALEEATGKLANFEINPTRAFPNALSKIGAILGVAMGAYAQGLSGGKLPNTALQIVNAAIDRDIEAQKVEYSKLKGLVDEKRNVYGMAMRLLGDEKQADALARTAAFQTFNAATSTMAKQFGIDANMFQQRFSGLGLLQRENQARATLDMEAAKAATKTMEKPKLGKELEEATGMFGGSSMTFKDLWRKSKEMYALQASYAWLPGEYEANTFNRTAKWATLEMVHALSGVAVRPKEHARIEKLLPKAGDWEGVRTAKMIAAMEFGLAKGVGYYRNESDAGKAWIRKTNPALAQLYEADDPVRRRRLIAKYLTGEDTQGQDFFTRVDKYTVKPTVTGR